MGFPSKLKNMNLFGNGDSYLGIVSEVTLPTLTQTLVDWRGGGMLGPIAADMGLERLELEFKLGGLTRNALRSYGVADHAGLLTRFAGAYQDDNSGRVLAAEATIMGRYSEVDFGTAKPGDDTEHTYTVVASYYRLEVDGEEWFEIDLLGGIFRVFGQDRYAEIRAAIGA